MGNGMNFPKAYRFFEESLIPPAPPKCSESQISLKRQKRIKVKYLLRVRVQQYHKLMGKGL